jgi:hypothetical protein
MMTKKGSINILEMLIKWMMWSIGYQIAKFQFFS